MSSEVAKPSVMAFRRHLLGEDPVEVHIIKISAEIQIEVQVGDNGTWLGECKALGVVVQGKDHTEVLNNMMEALALLAYNRQEDLDQSNHNLEVLRDAYRNVSYNQQALIEGLVKTNAELRKKVDALCKKIDITKKG